MKHNSLPGVPLVESPFFSKHFNENLRNSDPELYQIARELNTKGYAVLPFPDPDFEQKADNIINDLNPQYDWEKWKQNPERGLRVQDAWKTNADVKSLAVNPRLLEILRKLYGRRPIPFQTLNFPVGTQQHYHSDSIHFSCIPERFMCGVWVALEDIEEDQGPLEYYEGSHTWPIYTNEHLGVSCDAEKKVSQAVFDEAWEELVEHKKPPYKKFIAKKGDTLIWCANLLHGGTPHTDKNKTRWSQVTHYYFENCVYYTPIFSEPFKGLIQYRKITDITTGREVLSKCNGYLIEPKFMEQSKKGFACPPISRAKFNNKAYLEANPDVAKAGVDAYEHYIHFGIREDRPLTPKSLK